ncbi:hypothetical protein [Paraburkholderia graminis]|jgi:hypothetical protein
MKKFVAAAFLAAMWSLGYGAPPDENLVKSCLLAQAFAPAVAIRSLNPHEVTQEGGYAAGFNATYMFRYRGANVGYAESNTDQALIFLNRLHKVSGAIPLGDNRGIKRSAFDPTLAQWSVAKEGKQEFFCVSFNFDGLGRSGSFQNIHGGYLLNTKTKQMYFVVRDVKR